MPTPFEDPRKKELRDLVSVAIDAAGYDLIDPPEKIDYPPGAELQGRLQGDLQSMDAEGRRLVYYLRPGFERPLPQWLVNIVRVSRNMDGIAVYIVAGGMSDTLKKSCRLVGAGLLTVDAEGQFEKHLDIGELDEAAAKEECRKRVKDLRRQMENKRNLNLDSVDQRFAKVDELTAGMPSEMRDEYITGIEHVGIRWREWSDRLSVRLDELAGSCDDDDFRVVERLIQEGLGE